MKIGTSNFAKTIKSKKFISTSAKVNQLMSKETKSPKNKIVCRLICQKHLLVDSSKFRLIFSIHINQFTSNSK